MSTIVTKEIDLNSKYKKDVIIDCCINQNLFDLKVDKSLICVRSIILKSLQVKGDLTFVHTANIKDSLTVKGNLFSYSNLIVEGDVTVEGDVDVASLTVVGNLKINGYLVAEDLSVIGNLETFEAVDIADCLTVERDTNIGGYLNVGEDIIIGGALIVKNYVHSGSWRIRCKKLITHGIKSADEYWAAMPPFKNYKHLFEDEYFYCEDLQNKIHDEEKIKEIVYWEGWHPIQRAQLEMFFGLRREVPGNELVVIK